MLRSLVGSEMCIRDRFTVNMAEAGTVSIRAKTYKQEQNTVIPHATLAGGFVLVEKLGGGQRGEQGRQGEDGAGAGAQRLYGTGAPASSLGARNDSYLDTDTGIEYKKIDSTTWRVETDLQTRSETNLITREITQKWSQIRTSALTRAGNGLLGTTLTVGAAQNLFGQNISPVNWIRNRFGKTGVQVRFRLTRSGDDDGHIRVVMTNGGVEAIDQTLPVSSDDHTYRFETEIYPLNSDSFAFQMTFSDFGATTVLTVDNLEIIVVELPDIASPQRIQRPPDPSSHPPLPGELAYVTDTHGTYTEGLHYVFNPSAGFEKTVMGKVITQAAYDALTTKDPNAVYYIVG